MKKPGNVLKVAAVLVLALSINACVLTKIVSVPMRLVGAVVSIVPVVGNKANSVIQTAADAVDDVPI